MEIIGFTVYNPQPAGRLEPSHKLLIEQLQLLSGWSLLQLQLLIISSMHRLYTVIKGGHNRNTRALLIVRLICEIIVTSMKLGRVIEHDFRNGATSNLTFGDL